MVQFKVNLHEEALASLDAFCEASGASRSEVVETLVEDYLEELCKRVGALAQPDEEDEEEAEPEEAEADEDEDEDEEEPEEK